MGIEDKIICLCLNKRWQPIGVKSVRDAFSELVHPNCVALNIVYNAPDGSGINGWKSYDGQRNRFVLIDNLTKSGFEKLHEISFNYSIDERKHYDV